ncbi:hypothetical protein B0T10DRAFT_471720 [Thelonectria olida]|uniref:Serine aminopeptidase S33 domain-containing protein n=1 Tax=Thelonectria olida TaxID=1576542 RepID=A0A9P8WFH4_9HYPO|nr:hypothetical protein B0T10DRAFT_471720 [Thelonectria olida]
MELPQTTQVTEVETCDNSHTSSSAHALHRLLLPLTHLSHRSFFPGNAGHINYDRLCRGRDELPPKTDKITTQIGTVVGFHEYTNENSQSNVIVILAHGNTRPTRFMKDLLSSLLDCNIKAVVGRDFVGYDTSSQVPFHNGALEIAAHANDTAILDKMTDKYPDCQFILCGRSVGTFFWAGQLQHPKVIGAIGIVPLTSPVAVIQNMLETSTPALLRHSILRMTDFSGFAHAVAAATFPSNYTSPKLPGFATKGFEIEGIDPGVQGKQVVLFPSQDDELIPKGNVEDLRCRLEKAGCKVELQWTKGGHRALPSPFQLREAVDLILRKE